MPKRNVWYFIKRFKRNSVFIRNLLLFLAVMMMPLLMCGYYLSGQITNLLIEQNAASSISAIERIAGGLQNQLAEAEYMTTHAGFRDDIQLFLLSGAEDAVGYEKDIVEYLNTYVSVKKHIDSLYVYSFESEILIDNHNLYRISEFEDTSWLENVKDLEINDSLFIGRKKGAGYLDCITVIKPIYIIPNYMQGAVVCNISIKELSKSFGDRADLSLY